MTQEQSLATKLHEKFCNCPSTRRGICKCGFNPYAKVKDWFVPGQNRYFLHLARKCNRLIQKTEISEDEAISYAKDYFCISRFLVPGYIRNFFD